MCSIDSTLFPHCSQFGSPLPIQVIISLFVGRMPCNSFHINSFNLCFILRFQIEFYVDEDILSKLEPLHSCQLELILVFPFFNTAYPDLTVYSPLLECIQNFLSFPPHSLTEILLISSLSSSPKSLSSNSLFHWFHWISCWTFWIGQFWDLLVLILLSFLFVSHLSVLPYVHRLPIPNGKQVVVAS